MRSATLLFGSAALTCIPTAALSGEPGVAPSLKQTITESPSQATTVSVTTLGGYTTNSGPTLDEISGPVTDLRFDMTHLRRGVDTELLLGAEVKDREFPSQSEARNLEYRVTGTFAYEPGKDRRLVTKAVAEKSIEVDEELTKFGVEQTVELPRSSLTPFIKSSIYCSLPSAFNLPHLK